VTDKINHLSVDSDEFFVLSTQTLKMGASIRFTAIGNSMYPMIRNGDKLTIIPVLNRQIKLGDVILFTNKVGRPLVHRVIKFEMDGEDQRMITQGDHTSQIDGCIPKANVYGILSKIERQGQVINLSDPFYKFLGRLIVWYLRSLYKYPRVSIGLYHIVRKLPVFRRYLS
jgi:signal peptidase